VKLLVLAQTPPPLHGQSVMVQVLVQQLGNRPGLSLCHVNFQLSRDHADIGRWRSGKILRTIGLAGRAVVVGQREGCDTLYYVPSPPGKRGALYRDWLAMALCRPFFRRLVLHWQAAGLAEWLERDAHRIEQMLTRWFLGRADLSVVVSDRLRADGDYLHARTVAVVPNGVGDPGPPIPRREPSRDFQALFLGLCSEEKGLFVAADAVVAANARNGAGDDAPRFRLVAAGPFPDAAVENRFRELARRHPRALAHAGFVGPTEKRELFAASQCLIFPTQYPAEALPLVVLEALAADLPVLASRWRALPDVVTPECGTLVAPGHTDGFTDALLALDRERPPAGHRRARYLAHYTTHHFLERFAAALVGLRDR